MNNLIRLNSNLILKAKDNDEYKVLINFYFYK